jgi:hypothetical protein
MIRRIAPLLPFAALFILIGCQTSGAQAPAPSAPGATNLTAQDMAGHVITRRKLADCEAKAQRLS